MSGLGAGGKGFFALDVTDPNNPKHLFTVDHDESDKIITHWAHDESYREGLMQEKHLSRYRF